MDVFRIAAAGIAGWVTRLAFAGALAVAAYGVYVAWFASLGERDPGHDRASGSALTGIALGVAFVLCRVLLFMPGLRHTTRGGWYALAFGAFIALFATALTVSGGLRLIGDWERSSLSIPAAASGCYELPDTDDYCHFDWVVAGVHHTQVRPVDNLYRDGTLVRLWVDPDTGGAADHDLGLVAAPFVGTPFGLFFVGMVLAIGRGMIRSSKGLRRWVGELAWWRRLPARPRVAAPVLVSVPVPVTTTPGARNAAGEPEDTRPGVEPPEVTDAVERAHAQGAATLDDTVTRPPYRFFDNSRRGVYTRLGIVFAFCAAVLIPIVFLGWAYGQIVLIVSVAAGLCFGEFIGLLVSAFVRGSKGPDE